MGAELVKSLVLNLPPSCRIVASGHGTGCRSDEGGRWLMGLSQNYWREDETFGPQEVGSRDRRRAVRVTVAHASDRERAASEGYSIFRRNPAADSLQVQRRGIDDSIYGWRKPRFGAGFEGNLAPRPASAFCRCPRGLPVDGGDERLEAYSAHDLFGGAVVAG